MQLPNLPSILCVALIILFSCRMGFSEAPASIENIESYTKVGMSIEEMQKEVVEAWELWYSEQDPFTQRERGKARKHWNEYATLIAKKVKEYQVIPVEYNEWNNKSITLPVFKDVHLVIAAMATYESEVDNSLIGDRGEVGIMQCHPRWCLTRIPFLKQLSYRNRIITAKSNPGLSIEAAIKHLTASYGSCGIEIHSPQDWAYPVSYYGAGSKAIKNGKCISTNFARKRIYRMQKYKRILEQENYNI